MLYALGDSVNVCRVIGVRCLQSKLSYILGVKPFDVLHNFHLCRRYVHRIQLQPVQNVVDFLLDPRDHRFSIWVFENGPECDIIDIEKN